MIWPPVLEPQLLARLKRPLAASNGTAASPSTTVQTQTAKARITASTTKTQTAKARITATTTKTQTSVARLSASTTKTQTAKARVAATTTKTQPAKGRIKATTTQTQTARARIGSANLSISIKATPGMTVQYGTFALDETNGIIITSEPDAADTSTFGNWYCEFRCRLTPDKATGNDTTDDAYFGSLISNLETQLRIPRQKLLAKYGSTTFRDWDFNSSSQTAFLIQPELQIIRQNRRDFTYGWRVRCQFPGNIPNNAFRRDSTTTVGASLAQRRVCTITATWTSSPSVTAYQQFLTNGDAFFTAYLPSNSKDQYGTTGTWVRADENPAFNDENSLITATRTYWEVFAGRRDSLARDITTINQRRVFTAPSTWTSTTHTAAQNYLDGGDAFYASILPAPISSDASWVLVDEEPAYNDANHILTVVRTYHEVVKGLREYRVQVNTLANQLRQVVVSGSYYTTGSVSAEQNYKNGCQSLVTGILAGLTPAVTRYESKSVPKYEGFNTTTKVYEFTWTMNEIAYPQGIATDDPHVTINTLDIKVRSPRDPQSFTAANNVTRLSTCEARFSATIDYTSSQDPVSLWQNGLSAYVINAIITKLGPTVTSVEVVDSEVGAGLHNNTLIGRLSLIVTGGSILSLRLSQTVIQVPGRDFASRADGTTFSAYPYRDVAEKILKREAVCEYVLGLAAPTIFGAGDNTVSGFGFIDTGITAQNSIDDQNASGQMSNWAPGWFIDRRAPVPYSSVDIPTTRGDNFETVIHIQVETWRFLQNLEPGTTL